MTPSRQVDEIAASLTSEQGAALTLMRDGWLSGPMLDDAILDYLTPFRELGLVERQFGGMAGPDMTASKDGLTVRLSACWWFRLTPLGLEVRALLDQGSKS